MISLASILLLLFSVIHPSCFLHFVSPSQAVAATLAVLKQKWSWGNKGVEEFEY